MGTRMRARAVMVGIGWIPRNVAGLDGAAKSAQSSIKFAGLPRWAQLKCVASGLLIARIGCRECLCRSRPIEVGAAMEISSMMGAVTSLLCMLPTPGQVSARLSNRPRLTRLHRPVTSGPVHASLALDVKDNCASLRGSSTARVLEPLHVGQ